MAKFKKGDTLINIDPGYHHTIIITDVLDMGYSYITNLSEEVRYLSIDHVDRFYKLKETKMSNLKLEVGKIYETGCGNYYVKIIESYIISNNRIFEGIRYVKKSNLITDRIRYREDGLFLDKNGYWPSLNLYKEYNPDDNKTVKETKMSHKTFYRIIGHDGNMLPEKYDTYNESIVRIKGLHKVYGRSQAHFHVMKCVATLITKVDFTLTEEGKRQCTRTSTIWIHC